MPDDPQQFEAARIEYTAARAKSGNGRTALIRANEQVKILTGQVERLARKANVQDAELAAAKSKLANAKELADSLRDELSELEEETIDAHGAFAVFTNPINAVSLMPDDTPIALFPLRLETRYRTVGGKRFFCVRAYPDDVLVDTFQPEIAEAELTNVTNYWVHLWRAAGDVAGHRAAWTALVRSNGAGRAKWLIDQVAPLNPNDEPGPGAHVLVITPASPVPNGQKDPIAKFFVRVWSTAGAERDAAFAELEGIVGVDRANEVETTLVPVNFFDVAAQPDPANPPRVAFLDLPPRDTLPISKESWTRGARAWLLPERLVLLGFRNGAVVLQRIGLPIPADLQVGPDPSAGEDQQIVADGADLEIPEALRWTVDFDDAVAAGMAFNIELDQGPLPKFERLFVIGIRLGSTASEGKAELSQLIANHQASRKGFSILPQGRATNNTDAASAGYTWWEDPDESFRHFFESDPTDDPTTWDRRKDGAWLAGMLGVDRQLLKGSPNYYGTDQAEARAMNVALWPATLGYYMEQMLEPVFSEGTVLDTRAFFNRFLVGRGTVPLIRVGRQPYGVLPATAWSRMAWWKSADYGETARTGGRPDRRYLDHLFELTKRATALWGSLANDVANAAEPGDDPQQTLLSIVALHPTSAEFYQRYARTFTSYYNQLQFSFVPVTEVSFAVQQYIQKGLLALQHFGWTMPPAGELPEILEKIFLKKANLLKGSLVQAELSDNASLAVTRADGLNYIAWLKLAAETSHDVLRQQEGFANGVPEALLYQMLRHALDLGFIDAALTFRRKDLQLTEAAYRAERKEPKSMYVAAQQGGSRWENLYRADPAVTKDPSLRLGDYIPQALLTRSPYLASQLSALDVLKDATSGSLERAFVEHLDCLTYRLDAWRMGMQAVQLSHMREESQAGFAKDGIYIGAYGWLENVGPKAQTLVPKDLDGELASIFETPGAPPLVSDSSNFGHIHAPSLDHAVTAAILRNGHLANATPEEPDLLAVDLTSERVRLAQQVIEGMRNGQSLGALLGYRLERALHDEPDLFLDRLIYDLRRAFPLAGNRNLKTRVSALDKITKVEARNVVDGSAFADHIDEKNVVTYPYGLALPPLGDFAGPGLPAANEIGKIIDRHVAEMRSVADAVADLQIAEGVYQVVRGNYDRASGTLDAFSKGAPPPLPEVVTTPRRGRTLTHRIALHLKGGLLPADPANTTPRAKSEPALAQWIGGQLPDPATIFARVTWKDAGGVGGSLTPNLAQLGLGPVDLFYLIDAGGDRDMPGFDPLLIDFAEANGAPAPRHDAIFTLEYKPSGVAGLTLFEVAPLVRALRGAVLGARPLRATDLALSEEAGPQEDSGPIVRIDKVDAAVAGLQGTAAAIPPFITAIETATIQTAPNAPVDPIVARDAARDNIDAWLAQYAALVRPVVPFGLQAASLTAGVEGRRAPFNAMRKAIAEIIERWQKKVTEFDAVMALVPAAATDEERVALLIRAGRIVSTDIIAPIPALPNLEIAIAAGKGFLDGRLSDLIALHDDATSIGALLIAFESFVPVYQEIDQTPLDLTPFRESVLALAHDLMSKAGFLRDDIARRVKDANTALTRASTAVGDKKQAAAVEAVHAILGDAFLLLPEIQLSPVRLAEWNNAWTNRAALLAHLLPARPFPIDDWRIGVARVRDRVQHLELATFLGEALGAPQSPTLDAVQFPFKTNDAWLGLEFPALDADGNPFVVPEDKLLYAPHFGPGADIDPANANRTYSGLLIDEWVEVVPTDQVTSGLAFHFDRPNSEAPQAILLVTPPVQDGTWSWQDIVDTLHETLDFARIRAVEPSQLDRTALGPLLPAVLSAVTLYPITAALNLAFNNGIHRTLANE